MIPTAIKVSVEDVIKEKMKKKKGKETNERDT